jgi:hypothetical protein
LFNDYSFLYIVSVLSNQWWETLKHRSSWVGELTIKRELVR